MVHLNLVMYMLQKNSEEYKDNIHKFGDFFFADAFIESFFLVCKYYRCDSNILQEFNNMKLYEFPYNVIFFNKRLICFNPYYL